MPFASDFGLRICFGFCWALAVATCLACEFGFAGPAEQIKEDPPVATQPAAGDVSGQISPAGKAADVYALCRATGKQYKPDKFDKSSGQFLFKSLPGDAVYDIGLLTGDGARLEGIDLGWHEARMVRLAALRREQLKLPAERTRAFTQKDADELLKYVQDLKDFTDTRRAFFLRSDDGMRATMLVEVMRTTDFYAQKDNQIIWRIELWYFEYHYGGWERVANVERVLQRQRIPYPKWQEITQVYEPALSAYVDPAGKSGPLKFTIPDKLDPAHGRLANTAPKQDTQPTVIGLKQQVPAGEDE